MGGLQPDLLITMGHILWAPPRQGHAPDTYSLKNTGGWQIGLGLKATNHRLSTEALTLQPNMTQLVVAHKRSDSGTHKVISSP